MTKIYYGNLTPITTNQKTKEVLKPFISKKITVFVNDDNTIILKNKDTKKRLYPTLIYEVGQIIYLHFSGSVSYCLYII